MRSKLVIFPVFFLISFFQIPVSAQNAGKVSGIVKDSVTSAQLGFATIAIINAADSSFVKGGMTDGQGKFEINQLDFGKYILKISFVGYNVYNSEAFILSAANAEKNPGIILLKPSSTNLKEMNVEEKQISIEQKGDTTQYNANAYKAQPDASAEDLITKMPGISTDNKGNVTANSEQVKQVLVDGKPFFGDDPSMALKNLPADVIEKIQVFDKLSDQSQFTGFDDGTSQKTMNIITRQGRKNGQFGKIYAGYGTNDRYIAGGNINYFKGERRISVIGLFNNVNQQNFSTQDLLGAMGGGGKQGRGGYKGSSNSGGAGGSQMNNFLTGNQAGISATNSLGVNYSDSWGKKIKVTGSYFFNNTDNNNNTSLTRNYITTDANYEEKSSSQNINNNHRFNFKFEYSIDTLNKITITPKVNFQKNNSNSDVSGKNWTYAPMIWEYKLASTTNNQNTAENSGYTLSNNILFQHKFKKQGRTVSINLGTDANSKNGTGSLSSLSQYPADTMITDQRYDKNSGGYTLSSTLNYTEPLDSSSQLQFSYTPSYNENNSDKETNNFDAAQQDYLLRDTALSNKFNNTYLSNRAGISFRRSNSKYNFMAGVNVQYATLTGEEVFPAAFTVDKSFSNILPQAMFNYKFAKGTNLRIMYRSSTNTPSTSQLQNVVDNTNPILLTTGNPDLKQDYEQTLTLRYGKTKTNKATGLFVFLYGNYATNYIGNSSFTASKDTVVANGIMLKKGSQLTNPVNLNNYWNARSLITYVLPVSKIKCNLNFNGGLTFNRTPALINNETNLADNYNFSGGTGLTSNISEDIDFTLSYNANYSIVNNTLQTQGNNNYFYHTASIKFNYIWHERFVINTNATQTLYNGLTQSFNQNYMLWNASIGYKFLKSNSLEIKAGAYDILDQNKSISRNVTDTYIEDSQTQALSRYFMLTATYTLKRFKKADGNGEK